MENRTPNKNNRRSKSSKERILVTGGLGFIGSHLVERLQKSYRFIDVLDIKSGRDVRTFLPVHNYTHIFHLAALRSVPLSEKKPMEFIRTNCEGTCHLLRSYPKAKVINVSSSSANQVKSVYGATKLFSELLGDMHFNTLNVRLYNVFGPRQPLDSGAVVPQFIKSVLDGKKATIYGDGEQARDMTYVGDVCYQLEKLMFSKNGPGLYHVGYSNPITINNLLKLIYEYSGKEYKKPHYVKKRHFDIEFSKSPKEIDFIYGREYGLNATIEWMKHGNS